MPGFSHFPGNGTINNFRICFLQNRGFVTLQVTSRIKDKYSKFIRLIISEGDKIVRPFDVHSNETATVKKDVTKYKHMRKLMLVFLEKIGNRGI